MKRHLNESEIEQIIRSASEALSPAAERHLQSCEQCRVQIEEERLADRLLRRIQPLPAGETVSEGVFSSLRRMVSDKKNITRKDWVLTGSVTVLVVSLIISLIRNPLPDMFRFRLPSSLETFQNEMPAAVNRLIGTDIFTTFSFLRDLHLESGYVMVFVALIVFLFYAVLDRILLHRLFHG